MFGLCCSDLVALVAPRMYDTDWSHIGNYTIASIGMKMTGLMRVIYASDLYSDSPTWGSGQG